MTYSSPAGRHPLAGTAVTVRAVDRIREAAWQGLYWVLVREPDRTTWTLRHLDDGTGALSEPVHHSHPVGPDPDQAVGWAQGRRCVVGPAGVLNPGRVRGQIAWASSVNAAATRVAGGASTASS
jgi:hypothetical protein